MGITNEGNLSDCILESNCICVGWELDNVRQNYIKLIQIASNLPRTTVIEQSEKYWHGIVRSLIFRFPDDLEILQLPSRGIIQVKSASRVGLSDLGVNKARINYLYSKLIEKD